MSKDVPEAHAPVPVPLIQPAPITLNTIIPKPIQLACGALILIGALVLVTRPGFTESSLYSGLQGADAKLFAQKDKDGKSVPINDGSHELFGMVQFHNNDAEVARYYTYCESKPEMALRVFRKAMTEGNASAKIIAAHGSLFLAESGTLEASDYELLRKCMDKSESADVQKVAQRAVSDLTVIKSVDAPAKYEEVPADLPAAGSDDPPRKVATHKEELFNVPVLYVRWSSPDVAVAWLNANAAKGAWDGKLQRFVIP